MLFHSPQTRAASTGLVIIRSLSLTCWLTLSACTLYIFLYFPTSFSSELRLVARTDQISKSWLWSEIFKVQFWRLLFEKTLISSHSILGSSAPLLVVYECVCVWVNCKALCRTTKAGIILGCGNRHGELQTPQMSSHSCYASLKSAWSAPEGYMHWCVVV